VRDTLGSSRIRAALEGFGPRSAGSARAIHELPELADCSWPGARRRACPADVSEGNFVREGYDGELDRLRP
jgi:hypothetical protein